MLQPPLLEAKGVGSVGVLPHRGLGLTVLHNASQSDCYPTAHLDLRPMQGDGLQVSLAQACGAEGQSLSCRAAFAAAHEAVSPRTGFTLRSRRGQRRLQYPRVVLTGRAISVPFTAVLNGPEWTPTDSAKVGATCTFGPIPKVATPPDLALQAGVQPGAIIPRTGQR
jgi:hypothetical protein